MKIHWLNEKDEWEDYDKGKHASCVHKFLYWNETPENEKTLIVCPKQKGFISYMTLHQLAGDLAPAANPAGVGQVLDGSTIDWTSHGFQLNTPKGIRTRILEALGL